MGMGMGMESQTELTNDERQELGKIVGNPVTFAERILGLKLWSAEVELLRSIEENRRTAIKACHGVGKTLTLAIATLWWLARYPNGIVETELCRGRRFRRLTLSSALRCRGIRIDS